MKRVIYYFSGTGNSLRAAIKIGEVLGDTHIISMRSNPENVTCMDADIVGFIYPVYHWTIPNYVQEFIKKVQISSKAYIFSIAMPSLILGEACVKAEKLLAAKGLKLSYSNYVKGVANYVLVYPPLPSPSFVIPKTEKELDKIALEIKNKVIKKPVKENWLIKYRRSSVMDPYKQLAPYADYPFIITDDCISCGLCSQLCPVKNINLVNGKPSFNHHCEQCMACVCFCPKRAIQYHIPKEMLKTAKNTPALKIMGLPNKRKRYHHPYIKASDLIKDRIYIIGKEDEK